MCRSNGVRHPVLGLRALLLGFLAVLVAGASQAQEYIPNGSPIPQGIRYVNTTATGVNTSATFTSQFGGLARSHTVPVPVSSGTLGSLAKGAIRRVSGPVGWYFVLRDLINGAGWVIDELQHQVVDGLPRNETQQPPGTQMWCYQQSCSTVGSNLIPVVEAATGHKVVQHFQSGSFYAYNLSNTGQVTATRRTFTTWTPDYGTGHVPSQISDADLGNALKQSPEVVNAIMVDPQTGAPIRFPELVAAMNDLRKALEAAHGVTTPGQDVVVSPTYPDDGQNHEGSWPQFCSWASKVCDFIDWFKRDPDNGQDPPLPYETREPEMEEYDSGWGGGSCPAPYTVAVLDGEFEVSFVGICGFVEYLRPLAIALAWILSAFIVVGSSPKRF